MEASFFYILKLKKKKKKRKRQKLLYLPPTCIFPIVSIGEEDRQLLDLWRKLDQDSHLPTSSVQSLPQSRSKTPLASQGIVSNAMSQELVTMMRIPGVLCASMCVCTSGQFWNNANGPAVHRLAKFGTKLRP